MVGSPNVTCSTNGKWGELPSCEREFLITLKAVYNIFLYTIAVRCPSPVGDSTQLQTNSSDFTYSNVIQFSCKSNRRLVVGSKTSQCLSNGKWSHEPPKCKRKVNHAKDGTVRNISTRAILYIHAASKNI